MAFPEALYLLIGRLVQYPGYQYLRQVFTELPRASSVEQIEALLPGNVMITPAPFQDWYRCYIG